MTEPTMRTLTAYQHDLFEAHEKIISGVLEPSTKEDIIFCALGAAGEAGEVANLIKKMWREDYGNTLSSGEWEVFRLKVAEEITDTMVYLMLLATNMNINLDQSMEDALEKVYTRWPETRPKR